MKGSSRFAHPRLALAAVLLLVTLVAACGGDDDAAVDATTTTTTAAEPSSTTTTEPTVTSEEADLDLPRTVVYANLEVTLRSVTISNATPGSYLDDEPVPGDEEYGFATVTVEAELTDPGDRLEVDELALDPGSGASIPAEPVGFISGATVDPGVASELTVAFPIDAGADLTDAALVVEEPGRIPARLPLAGPVPDDPYPIVLDVTGGGTVSYDGGCGNSSGTVELTGGEVDVDAGADHNDNAIEPNQSKRAKEGERWLRLRVVAVAEAGTCGGTIVSDDAFRLLIDGLPTAPLNRDNELLDNGAGAAFVWGWTVPVDASLMLQVGMPDGTTVDLNVPLPGDLP